MSSCDQVGNVQVFDEVVSRLETFKPVAANPSLWQGLTVEQCACLVLQPPDIQRARRRRDSRANHT